MQETVYMDWHGSNWGREMQGSLDSAFSTKRFARAGSGERMDPGKQSRGLVWQVANAMQRQRLERTFCGSYNASRWETEEKQILGIDWLQGIAPKDWAPSIYRSAKKKQTGIPWVAELLQELYDGADSDKLSLACCIELSHKPFVCLRKKYRKIFK